MIAIIGHREDHHNQAIIRNLVKLKSSFVIVDKFASRSLLSLKLTSGRSFGRLKLSDNEIDVSKITAIWYRYPPQVQLAKNLDGEAYNFALSEWQETLYSLWSSTDSKWVNHPDRIMNISNKMKQLRIAHDSGLLTPRSLVTNEPAALRSFYYENSKDIVCKPLRGSKGIPKGKMIFTHPVSYDDIESCEDLIYAPCLFQEYIPKQTELRIVIIGRKLYVTEIYSQLSSKTKHDWRNYDDFKITPYMNSSLPENISESLIKLMNKTGLNFACIDIIKTPTNEFYFLEVNSAGKWLWTERLTHTNISMEIARYLNSDPNISI